MVFDYEAAWSDLLLVLGEKPQWGTRQLEEEMSRILTRRRVNESGLAQMLRLYGTQVDQTNRSSVSTPAEGSSLGVMTPSTGQPSSTEVDHDSSYWTVSGSV